MTKQFATSRRRGQPLIALALLLTCWTGLRLAMPGPFGDHLSEPERSEILAGRGRGGQGPPIEKFAVLTDPVSGRSPELNYPLPDDRVRAPVSVSPVPAPPIGPLPVLPSPIALGQGPRSGPRTVHAAGHNLMWMAAMRAMPLPGPVAEVLEASATIDAYAKGPSIPDSRSRRWSADAWLALRGGQGALAAPVGTGPSYGGSQAGAVLRYHLAPQSVQAPQLYLRAVNAFASPRQQDLASGLSVRPVAKLPLALAAEMRASQRGDKTSLRPAAFVTAGVDNAPLGKGFGLRGFGQAGYVGGKDATGFLDANLVAERAVTRIGPSESFVGAGAWAGAQRGAARLDIGPTASLKLQLGEGTGRLAVDYRLRIAGNAAPASGAALTLSAGF